MCATWKEILIHLLCHQCAFIGEPLSAQNSSASRFSTTACIYSKASLRQRCYLIRLSLSFAKTSLHLHHRALRHSGLTTEGSDAPMCLPAQFFFFHLTSFLLSCCRAQYVIAPSRYCWQGVTFRWECTKAPQVTFVHCQAKIPAQCSVWVLKSYLHCHCWASVRSPDFVMNLSASSQISPSLILKITCSAFHVLQSSPVLLWIYLSVLMLLSEII